MGIFSMYALGVLLPGIAGCSNRGTSVRIDNDLSARKRLKVSCSLI
jgi:hypothetical protein